MTYLELALGETEVRGIREKRGKAPGEEGNRVNRVNRVPPRRCARCERWIADHAPGADAFCPRCPGWDGFFRRIVPPHAVEQVRAEREAFAALVRSGVSPRQAAALVEEVEK